MPTGTTLLNVPKHQRIINAQQVAQLYNMSIASWRQEYGKGKLLPAVRLSERRICWRARDLIEHLAKRREVLS
jgi:predicted DNA-binding transcriptional regulator AlpA